MRYDELHLSLNILPRPTEEENLKNTYRDIIGSLKVKKSRAQFGIEPLHTFKWEVWCTLHTHNTKKAGIVSILESKAERSNCHCLHDSTRLAPGD